MSVHQMSVDQMSVSKMFFDQKIWNCIIVLNIEEEKWTFILNPMLTVSSELSWHFLIPSVEFCKMAGWIYSNKIQSS